MTRNVLFINSRAPHGTSYAQEQLQMAMVFGAFEQSVSLLFIGQGLYCLVKNQQTQAGGFQNFSKFYKSLEQYYDINQIYVDQQSMQGIQLSEDDFVVSIVVVDKQQQLELMQKQDVIFTV